MLWLDLGAKPLLPVDSRISSDKHRQLIEYRRSDYLGDPKIPLNQAVISLASNRLNREVGQSVCLLAMPRMWGGCFNPVAFYFGFDADGKVDFVVAQINNTPWNERHEYVLDAADQNTSGTEASLKFAFDKSFHVSPFFPMTLNYIWRFRIASDSIGVAMRLQQDGEPQFDARMFLQRGELNAGALRSMALGFPFQSLATITGIYWQALVLRLKGARFYDHPETLRS
ncbi:MAG: hypothetical protein DHS20C11_33650 [Lysobacteraceae bacterium]|nr:MAG: hypothetical protein DHS20C11_33650 [Xanthomonadaceae bacterium]